jgi:hypothetical protein
MLQDFFKLNGQPGKITSQDDFITHFERSDSLINVEYMPDSLELGKGKNKLRDLKFINVSFSHTRIKDVIFRNCRFEDCLFIGTVFDTCEFHNCSFVNCNPYKADFVNTYIDPSVFAHTLGPKNHVNIGVGLFQQLLKDSVENRQPEFAQTAEYYFRKWKRFLMEDEHRKHIINHGSFYLKWIPNLLHDWVAGYGLKTLRFLVSSTIFLVLITLFNHWMWSNFGMRGPDSAISDRSLVKTFYYTINTITTLGYGDITPSSSIGMTITGIESLFGIVWLAILAHIIIKKVIR